MKRSGTPRVFDSEMACRSSDNEKTEGGLRPPDDDRALRNGRMGYFTNSFTEAMSTFTPGPMLVERAMLLK